ncbi:MAG: hypothetical protein K2L76_00875 [Muribaculaceae bacterium]|nr:hypothetical protein [Muribaculaceae bacterium]
MMTEYTRDDMLRLWRTRAGLEPSRTDCRIETVEGIDADAYLEPAMRAWYLRLLDTADTALLPVDDVHDEIELAVCPGHEAVEGQLPPRARRLLEVRMTGWLNAAVPCTPASATRRHALALNPYSAPGPAHPLCSMDGRRIHMRPFTEDGDVLVLARAVVDPGPDRYILDDSLLSTIDECLKYEK